MNSEALKAETTDKGIAQIENGENLIVLEVGDWKVYSPKKGNGWSGFQCAAYVWMGRKKLTPYYFISAEGDPANCLDWNLKMILNHLNIEL